MQFSLTALKYEDIRNNIINFLISQNPSLSQFDFSPASNISILVNSMSYITMLLNYQISNVANNIFLDSTNNRMNAVSIAKTLGYIPHRPIASTITGTINYSGSNFNSNSQIIIQPGQLFLSTPSNYPFINLIPIVLSYINPLLLSTSFILTQGSWLNYSYIATGLSFQSFTIADTTIDNNNFILTSANNSNGLITTWTQSKSFSQIQNNANIYYLQESNLYEYQTEVHFGNGLTGAIPNINEIINVQYLSTLGSQGNGETNITIPQNLQVTNSQDIIFNQNNLTINIPSNVISTGGEDAEDLISIQNSAPLFYSTTGVLVTQNDYINTLSNLLTGIHFNVSGAENIYGNNSQYLGNIYITGVPKLTSFLNQENLYLTPSQESQITSLVNSNSIIGTYQNIVKPTFIYINLDTYIEVANSTPQNVINQIITNTTTNITNYFNSLTNLGQSFRESQVISAIVNTSGVLSSTINVSYGFLLNSYSFYSGQNNLVQLPIVYVRNSAGDIVTNQYGIPETENFIKTNTTILENLNSITGSNYTVTTLPPSLSSIYGELSNPNLNRYLYSQDYYNASLINIFLNSVNSSGVASISYESLEFQGQQNLFTLVDSGIVNQWNFYYTNIPIGTVTYESSLGTFTVSIFPTQTTTLSNIGITNPIDVVEIVLNTTSSYFQLQTEIDTLNLANILLQETNNLGQLSIVTATISNVVTTSVTLSNAPTLNLQGSLYPVILTNVTATSATMTINSLDILNITYANSVFTLSNINQDLLNELEFQNTVNLDSQNNIIVSGLYNGSSIGNFSYMTGLLSFNSEIYGTTGSAQVSTTPYLMFSGNYSDTNPVDIINFVPNNQYNSQGSIIGTLTDFDGTWNQFIIANINTPQLIT